MGEMGWVGKTQKKRFECEIWETVACDIWEKWVGGRIKTIACRSQRTRRRTCRGLRWRARAG